MKQLGSTADEIAVYLEEGCGDGILNIFMLSTQSQWIVSGGEREEKEWRKDLLKAKHVLESEALADMRARGLFGIEEATLASRLDLLLHKPQKSFNLEAIDEGDGGSKFGRN